MVMGTPFEPPNALNLASGVVEVAVVGKTGEDVVEMRCAMGKMDHLCIVFELVFFGCRHCQNGAETPFLVLFVVIDGTPT